MFPARVAFGSEFKEVLNGLLQDQVQFLRWTQADVTEFFCLILFGSKRGGGIEKRFGAPRGRGRGWLERGQGKWRLMIS